MARHHLFCADDLRCDRLYPDDCRRRDYLLDSGRDHGGFDHELFDFLLLDEGKYHQPDAEREAEARL